MKTKDNFIGKTKSHTANSKPKSICQLAKNRVTQKVLQTLLNKDVSAAAMLYKIKEFDNNRLINLNQSGLKDNSSHAKINKDIINKRFNYLSEKIIPWISRENVFFQNFGDALSSVEVLREADGLNYDKKY